MEELTLIGKQESTLVRSADGQIRFKLAHLRSLYVLSNYTAEEFAEKFNLDIDALNRAIRDGGWEGIRAKYSDGDTSQLLQATRDQLQTQYENELAQFELLTFQEQQQIERLRMHRARFGDLFLHDQITGDLKLDAYGQPIPLPLPNSPGKIHAKTKTFELLQGLTQCLAAAKELGAARAPVKTPEAIEKARQEELDIDAEVFGKRSE